MGSLHFDQVTRESEWSKGWKRDNNASGSAKLVYDPDKPDPPYQMALPYEAGLDYVYFIHAPEVGRVKIGWSVDPVKRLNALQGSSPVALRLVKLIRGGRDFEQRLHFRFREHRLTGEWFSDEILSEWARDPES